MGIPNILEKDRDGQAYPAGAVVFREGDPGDSMFIVREGEVEVRAGGGRVVEVVGPDGIFGEMALIDREPRSATVVARTDCVLQPIAQKQFLFMVEETPFFAIRVMRVMSARLRRGNEAPGTP